MLSAKRRTFLTEAAIAEFQAPLETLKDAADVSSSERFFVSAVLTRLSRDSVEQLRSLFASKKDAGGIGLVDFVAGVTQALRLEQQLKEQSRRLAVLGHLCSMFYSIDVDNLGVIQWEQFTSFLVDSGQGSGRDDGDAAPQNGYRYKSSLSLKELGRSGKTLLSACYFPDNDRMAFLEKKSAVFLVFDSRFHYVDTYRYHAAAIRLVEYIPPLKLYAAASLDSAILLFNENNAQINRAFTVQTCPTAMLWVRSQRLLCFGTANGKLFFWDVQEMEERHALNKLNLEEKDNVHTDAILALSELHGLGLIASGSMDRTIRLWDVQTGRHRNALRGHKKGVACLAYAQDHRLLFSGGFDFDVLVWNPFIEHLIMRLQNHLSAICSIQVLPQTSQLVSADRSGQVRVWNLKNFFLLGSMMVYERKHAQQLCLLSVVKRRQLVSIASTIHVFEYRSQERPLLADEEAVFDIIFNPHALTIATASSSCAKLWSAQSGRLLKTLLKSHDDATDLSAMCLDANMQKLMLGNQSGAIQAFNCTTGAAIKDMSSHVTEVGAMCYCRPHQMLISAAWGGTIQIHDEATPKWQPPLRKMSGAHVGEILQVCYSDTTSLIASGCSAGVVQLWDFEYAKAEEMLLLQGSLSQMAFLNPFPLLVTTDAAGKVCLWATRPSPLKGKLAYTWTHAHFTRMQMSAEEDEETPETESEAAERPVWLSTLGEDTRPIGITALRVINQELLLRMRPPSRLDRHGDAVTTQSTSTGFKTLRRQGDTNVKEAWAPEPKAVSPLEELPKAGRTLEDDVFDVKVVLGDEHGVVQILDISDLLRSLAAFSAPTAASEVEDMGRRYSSVQPFRPLGRKVPCLKPRRFVRSSVSNRMEQLLRKHQQPSIYDHRIQSASSDVDGEDRGEPESPRKPKAFPRAPRKVSSASGKQRRLPKAAVELVAVAPDAAKPSVVAQWQAHGASILSIECIQHPWMVITSSEDKLVKIWSMEGELLGSLCQGGCPAGAWKVQMDSAAFQAQRRVEVKAVDAAMKNLERRRFLAKRASVMQRHVSLIFGEEALGDASEAGVADERSISQEDQGHAAPAGDDVVGSSRTASCVPVEATTSTLADDGVQRGLAISSVTTWASLRGHDATVRTHRTHATTDIFLGVPPWGLGWPSTRTFLGAGEWIRPSKRV